MTEKRTKSSPKGPAADAASELRIIGGSLRGRRIGYSGDLRTRPMKDRVREAVFNLVGPRIVGKRAIDLFAGTGAIGLEAVSRGAQSSLFVERHFPTAGQLRRNIAALQVEDRCQVIAADAFFVVQHRISEFGQVPWVVFVSPPFALYQDRRDDLQRLLESLLAAAPEASLIVVEADDRLDFSSLPRPDAWDVRQYPPAIVGILQVERAASQDEIP